MTRPLARGPLPERGARGPHDGRASRRLGAALRGTAILVGGLCAVGVTGCATVSQHNLDRPVRTRTEQAPAGRWEVTGQAEILKDDRGAVTAVRVAASRDRACRITDVHTVDRTVWTERVMQNEQRSRVLGYTIGGLGAAGAVTNVAVAVQTDDKDAREVLTILGSIGAFLSISLITMIVREFGAIDTETHVGLVDLPASRHGRCDQGPPAGARVRLLRTRDSAIAEGVVSPEGTVTLPVDAASLRGDAVYALEVDGAIVTHVEIPSAPPADLAPARGDSAEKER